MQSEQYDSTIQHLMEYFCEAILKEIDEATTLQRRRIEAESFVQRYGKKKPGFIDFDEFKQIYKNHVHMVDENNFSSLQYTKSPWTRNMPEDSLLQRLFNKLADQRQEISRDDFGNTIR